MDMPGEMTVGARVKRAIFAVLITVAALALVRALVPASAALWMRAFHAIAVISWMAGMLYLPRLFINHIGAQPGGELDEALKGMERRLLEYIINPAMIASWVLGLWMAWEVYQFQGGWLHVKIALALAMSAVHGYFAAAMRRFQTGRNTRSTRHWRIMNEVPTLLMIVMVILVIVKPF